MEQKEYFKRFLSEHFPTDAFLEKFERYHSWLIEENAKINLISRQADPNDIWTIHFLDSLLSIKCVDFSERRVLDFGTGGGLPGLPLAICFDDMEVTLLDSRRKKIEAVKRASVRLGLKNCRFEDQRIEKLGSQYREKFDMIVCRSVKIEPQYKFPLLSLLKPQGKIVLYKSKVLDDIHQFKEHDVQITDVGNSAIGERKIIVVTKY
ncbi:MAG: 16S rRNA (guanine(527)-N(7))-methyltransferase RsmG [Chitinispirillales bacterium]|jgi:16S rRNA (guanine527-N7)-methyltransferase|nr:16S rRNA (guanine(527)-N(7))-methyltransferase RsmG [Chitinispirillales bacterium]